MAGRKNKYDTHVKPRFDDIVKWCEEGYTEEQICKQLGVSVSAFAVYKNENLELVEVLSKGKAVADDKVEQALYKTAIGFMFEEDQVTNKGDVVKVQRYSKPNTTAQIFWLKNRRREQWRDKQEIEHSGGMDMEINLTGFDDESN